MFSSSRNSDSIVPCLLKHGNLPPENEELRTPTVMNTRD